MNLQQLWDIINSIPCDNFDALQDAIHDVDYSFDNGNLSINDYNELTKAIAYKTREYYRYRYNR